MEDQRQIREFSLPRSLTLRRTLIYFDSYRPLYFCLRVVPERKSASPDPCGHASKIIMEYRK